MGLKLNATNGGGSVELDVPDTVNSDFTLTIPAATGDFFVNGNNDDVGIGTNSPAAQLHVKDSDHTSLKVESTGDGNRAGIEFTRQTSAGESMGTAAIWVESSTDADTPALQFGVANNASMQSQISRLTVLNNGQLQFNSGYGSVATAYGVRAWVNFNAESSGTNKTIRQDGNVSSVTDRGVGKFTVNFETDMPDANFAMAASAGNNGSTGSGRAISRDGSWTTGTAHIRVIHTDTTAVDDAYVGCIFVR